MEIEARNLGKRFGDVLALCDVSFDVPAGSRVALVGPNGSGKSTLNRALMGLIRYDGEIRIDGCSPLTDRIAVARRMAYVPQIAPSLAAPVRDLVGAIARVRGGDVADVEKAAARLDLDLATVARRPFRGLSGGTKQKLLIALALAARPSLLILDEPTGSLDARTRERFFPLFEELASETTVVLCSHRLEEVRQLVNRVLLLEEGRLAYEGAAADFLAAGARSLVEVCVEGDGAGRWLRERGFRRGTGRWWVRSAGQWQKGKLLAELTTELGEAVRDLNVRDLEVIEIDAEDRDGE